VPVRAVRRKRAQRANTGKKGSRNFSAREYRLSRDLKDFALVRREAEDHAFEAIAALEYALNISAEVSDDRARPPQSVTFHGGQRCWTEQEDEAIRAAWNTTWPPTFVWSMLSKWMGRTVAALKSRGYTLGLRKRTKEEKEAWHARATERRAVIEEACRSGARRKELADRLGISLSYIAIQRRNLEFNGLYIVPVPVWGDRSKGPPVWQIVGNRAFAEYRDKGPKPLGERCACKHYETEHVHGMCANVNKRGDVCECPEFVLVGKGRKDFRNESILRRATSLDQLFCSHKPNNDGDAGTLLNLVAAPLNFLSLDAEVSECIQDDFERYAQMGYISTRSAHLWA
jgi:hypothetical protein